MLDWFYDTPIVQEITKINKKEIVLGKIIEKRLKGRLKRNRKNKTKKRMKNN